MTEETPSLSLLKGAKADVAAELASPPAEKFDINVLTSAQIDAFLNENGVDLPEGWSKFAVEQKRKWVLDNLDISEDVEAGVAEATADAAPVAAEAPAPAVVEAPVAEEVPAETVKKPKKTKGKVVEATKVLSGEIVGPDNIADMVHQIENMTEGEAKTTVIKLADAGELAQFKLGGVLALIQAHGWFKPHSSFREYVEQEIGMHYRKATYWVGIYNALVEANISWDKVKGVGWTKLKEIAEVLTHENLDYWVSTALANNTITLIDIVKAYKAKQGGVKQIEDGAAKTVTTMTFKVHQDQKETIKAALEKAKSDTGTTVDTVALEHICADFLGSMSMLQRLQKLGVDEALKAIEKAFPNVNLSVTVTDAAEAA